MAKRNLDLRLSAVGVGVAFPIHRAVREAGNTNFVRNKKGAATAFRALHDVTFDLVTGDRLAVIGANGAGKSTLLRVLSRTQVPDTGHVLTQGHVSSLVNINVGIQASATGHRNITLRGLVAGRSRKEIEEKRGWIVEFSELGEFLDMPFETYSSGMRMRLNFAIATAFQPEILLMDEWLSAGDIRFREKATKHMQTLVDEAGILVLASHNRKMLEQNCSTAIWIDAGEIKMRGSVGEVHDAFLKSQKQPK